MNYTIEFSDRKGVSLSVKGGTLKVKAPTGTKRESIDRLIYKHRRWISNHLSYEIAKNSLNEKLANIDTENLKQAALNELTALTEHFADIMNLKYQNIRISSAKTRFGSCSSNGVISYSYRLMLYPREAREYVVVHELAHLREMNHSKRFYSIIEKYMPDYKIRKNLLKTPLL